MYRNLNSECTVKTIETLQKRVDERFPSSGLSKVCLELCTIANESKARSEMIARPNVTLRVGLITIVLMSMAVLLYSISLIDVTIGSFTLGEFIQIIEAGINDLVLMGAAIFFLVTMEARVKRSRALTALHELRSIAHVIDMHQLTKDPSQHLTRVVTTPSSPRREMSAFELTRYLDYCSEMLSLTGKVAALYAQNFRDSVVLSAVNEIENLTTGLSRKIWQKIIILHKLDDSTSKGSGIKVKSD